MTAEPAGGAFRAAGPRVEAFGDAAVLVSIDGPAGLETSIRVWALSHRIEAAIHGLPGWEPPVPAAASILIPVDPVEPGVVGALATIDSLLDSADEGSTELGLPVRRTEPDHEDLAISIPVRYGGPDGPDLEAVAAAAGLSVDEVIRAHSGPVYAALFLGFAPGFAYLGPLPTALVLPRRPEPRAHVPAGSVAIAGPQTTVYPVDSPGGWWILGKTDLPVWDPRRDPPALIRPGARVRFVPVRAREQEA